MDAVIFLVVVVGLAAFVARPLYATGREAPDSRRIELEARREALMATLRDLEVDSVSGLVSPDEYERQRDATEADIARLLEDLRRD